MFGLKKKGREKAQHFHSSLKAEISPHIAKVSEKLRLASRIRLANRWAGKHPKRMMVYYMTFAFWLLAFSILIDFIPCRKRDVATLGIETIPSMNDRLQNLSNTEIQNERIKNEIAQLGQRGLLIRNELDSLLKLPVKTHEDSVRILTDYRILKKAFNNQEYEPKKD